MNLGAQTVVSDCSAQLEAVEQNLQRIVKVGAVRLLIDIHGELEPSGYFLIPESVLHEERLLIAF